MTRICLQELAGFWFNLSEILSSTWNVFPVWYIKKLPVKRTKCDIIVVLLFTTV